MVTGTDGLGESVNNNALTECYSEVSLIASDQKFKPPKRNYMREKLVIGCSVILINVCTRAVNVEIILAYSQLTRIFCNLADWSSASGNGRCCVRKRRLTERHVRASLHN